MSHPSDWPLPKDSYRFVTPGKFVSQMRQHPLCSGLYPRGLGYYKSASKHHMERRAHDDNLLIYCIEGRGELCLDDRKISVQSGDLVCLPKGISHSYQASRRKPWSIYWVHFDGEQVQAFIDYIGIKPKSYILALGRQPQLVASFEQLLSLRQASHRLDAYIHAANQLRQLLTFMPQLQPSGVLSASEPLDLAHIHSTMLAHVHQQLELDTLAAEANLSKFHFIKKYKALTGTTPINHFIHLKIERACQLLDVSGLSIGEVSYAVGYDDAYYFSRIFKKVMGLSPSQYRSSRHQSPRELNR